MHRAIPALPFFLLILCCVFFVPALVAADTPVEPETPPEEREATSEQLRLNEQAVEAMVAGNPGRAVALLSEAQRLGELNILALNLGRAYHAAGNCARAREVLESVPQLPAVERPSPERINERAAEYLAEVDETCREEEEQADLEAPAPEDQPAVEAPPEVEGGADMRQFGLYSALTGGVFVLAGGGLHMAARTQRSNASDRIHDERSFENGVNTEITQAEVQAIESRANTLDSVALGSAIIGGAALVVGTYLFLSSDELNRDEPNLSFGISDDAWSLSWTLRF